MKPWYAWSPKDYEADTRFISDTADLVYRRLLDQYWLNEGPIPLIYAGIAKAVRFDTRVVKRHLHGELAPYWMVLYKDEGVLIPLAKAIATPIAMQQLRDRCAARDAYLFNKRMQAELEIAQEKHEVAANNGRLGGLAKAKANALANGVAPTTTTTPTSNSNKHSSQPGTLSRSNENESDIPEMDYSPQQVIDLYHELLPALIPIKRTTDKLEADIRIIHRTPKIGCHKIEHWRNYFLRISRSDWITGRAKGKPSRYSLRKLVEIETYTKIAEGHYD